MPSEDEAAAVRFSLRSNEPLVFARGGRNKEDMNIHQKYPSCFFFSIDASPPSLSMMRPCRSLVVVSSIS